MSSVVLAGVYGKDRRYCPRLGQVFPHSVALGVVMMSASARHLHANCIHRAKACVPISEGETDDGEQFPRPGHELDALRCCGAQTCVCVSGRFQSRTDGLINGFGTAFCDGCHWQSPSRGDAGVSINRRTANDLHLEA